MSFLWDKENRYETVKGEGAKGCRGAGAKRGKGEGVKG